MFFSPIASLGGDVRCRLFSRVDTSFERSSYDASIVHPFCSTPTSQWGKRPASEFTVASDVGRLLYSFTRETPVEKCHTRLHCRPQQSFKCMVQWIKCVVNKIERPEALKNNVVFLGLQSRIANIIFIMV